MDSLQRAIRRLATEVEPVGECLLWTGGGNGDGYGSIWASGKVHATHRLAYEAAFGPIPTGLVVDHVCHNSDPNCTPGRACQHRRCINPAHMELVTPEENTRRGGARQTHCRWGHAFTDANTYHYAGRRCCRACNRGAAARSQARRKAAVS